MYQPMIETVLKRCPIFDEQRNDMGGSYQDKLTKNIPLDPNEENRKLHRDPLFWAITQPWTDTGPLPVVEVVNVASHAILKLDKEALTTLSASGVFDLIADIALLSNMMTTLKAQFPPVKTFPSGHFLHESKAFVAWMRRYRGSGLHYQCSWKGSKALTNWVAIHNRLGIPHGALQFAGMILEELCKSDELTGRQLLQNFWIEMNKESIVFLKGTNVHMSVSEIADTQDVRIMQHFTGFDSEQFADYAEKVKGHDRRATPSNGPTPQEEADALKKAKVAKIEVRFPRLHGHAKLTSYSSR